VIHKGRLLAWARSGTAPCVADRFWGGIEADSFTRSRPICGTRQSQIWGQEDTASALRHRHSLDLPLCWATRLLILIFCLFGIVFHGTTRYPRAVMRCESCCANTTLHFEIAPAMTARSTIASVYQLQPVPNNAAGSVTLTRPVPSSTLTLRSVRCHCCSFPFVSRYVGLQPPCLQR
jgi:hypothetical protein